MNKIQTSLSVGGDIKSPAAKQQRTISMDIGSLKLDELPKNAYKSSYGRRISRESSLERNSYRKFRLGHFSSESNCDNSNKSGIIKNEVYKYSDQRSKICVTSPNQMNNFTPQNYSNRPLELFFRKKTLTSKNAEINNDESRHKGKSHFFNHSDTHKRTVIPFIDTVSIKNTCENLKGKKFKVNFVSKKRQSIILGSKCDARDKDHNDFYNTNQLKIEHPNSNVQNIPSLMFDPQSLRTQDMYSISKIKTRNKLFKSRIITYASKEPHSNLNEKYFESPNRSVSYKPKFEHSFDPKIHKLHNLVPPRTFRPDDADQKCANNPILFMKRTSKIVLDSLTLNNQQQSLANSPFKIFGLKNCTLKPKKIFPKYLNGQFLTRDNSITKSKINSIAEALKDMRSKLDTPKITGVEKSEIALIFSLDIGECTEFTTTRVFKDNLNRKYDICEMVWYSSENAIKGFSFTYEHKFKEKIKKGLLHGMVTKKTTHMSIDPADNLLSIYFYYEDSEIKSLKFITARHQILAIGIAFDDLPDLELIKSHDITPKRILQHVMSYFSSDNKLLKLNLQFS